MAAKLNLMEDEWTQQPPPSVRCGINRQNQFGAKVDCYYLASELRNGHPRVTGPSGLASDFQSQIVVGNAPCTASRPFTVVVVMAFPQANIAAQAQIYVGSGNGFRLDTNTTEGGMYGLWTANGVANSAMPHLYASNQFDMRKIVLVSDWTPSGISSWWRRDGFSAQSFSETIGYIAPTDTRLLLGLNPNGAAKFYGVYILRGNVGEAGARKLIENPWQIFEPEQIPLFYSAGGGGATNLSIFDALHSHAGDNLTFSLDTYLAAQDSTHAHSADNLTLDATTSISLVLSESLHGLSSDVIAFITGSYLQVADALHGHSADALTLATASFLAVADALHSHAADNLTLDTSNATPLTTQDSTHAHSADNNALTLDTWLAIVEAVHTHSADNVSISSEELLAIADALHALASDALVLSLPSPPGTCPTAAEIAAAILAAAQITPIHSDMRKVNNQTVDGTGTDGDPWGPV